MAADDRFGLELAQVSDKAAVGGPRKSPSKPRQLPHQGRIIGLPEHQPQSSGACSTTFT